MRFGSTATGALLGAVFLALLLYLEMIPFLPQSGPPPPLAPEMSVPERFTYFGSLFAALADWAKVWMEFQDMIMAASLFFVLWHREAQIYALAPILSHAFIFTMVGLVPTAALTLELAALSHWLWIPALVVLTRAWPELDKRSAYGAWCTIAIAQLVFSLCFDIPDGIQFLLALV